eukprot:CAMPEP_0172440756 /NCGR_PEP_ID=MMETSP1065-20121228/1368_1 /TAXON_ID=265537 /ORGANISM="Amphiprora paludosa, Strain CCMP125" /LENGTH=39 /DNA_ID= /DNA_START= /DNA_END= /DNA_ORIENTATION=
MATPKTPAALDKLNMVSRRARDRSRLGLFSAMAGTKDCP